MNPDLIPRYDMLGLPGPAWLFQALMALTLALHWLLLGGAVGGTAVVLVEALRARRRGVPSDLVAGLAPFLPFFLSMAMTMGIAPLLFVQVLYGHLFYTANILLGWWWLAVLGLVTVNFYLLWWAWRRTRRGEPVGWALPAVVLALFLVAAIVFSMNARLTQRPLRWEGYRTSWLERVKMRDGSYERAAMAMAGFLAAGGLLVTVLRRAGPFYGTEAGEDGRQVGLRVAVPALAVQLAFMALFAFAATGNTNERQAVFLGPEAVFSYTAGTAFIAALVLAVRARRTPSLAAAVWPLAVYFVGLLGLAATRDTVRRQALAGIYNPAEVPVHPEWLNFGVFAVFVVAGTGVIVCLLRLARRRPAASA